MKKLYLLLGMLASAGLAQAQTCGTTISTFPYVQNFESGAGSWVAGGTTPSWALGTPAGTVINSAASGTNAWVTNLTGDYNNNEQSFVQGPCFNFSTLVQPTISLKIWWNMEQNYDKAALQSSIDGGTTWQHVGAFNDPDNWYNNNSTLGPGVGGGIKLGWSGRASTSNGSGGWVTAKHTLNGLGGQASVRLRIAFGSDGSGVDNGFAFDDISIFEAPANDAGVVALTSPVLVGCGFTNNEQVCITVKNFGSAPTTTIPVSYQIGTGAPVNETITTPIAPGATLNYCFTARANLAAGGNYNFTITTNLAGDGDPSNNTLTRTIVNPLVSTFPSIQDFESGVTGSPGTLPAGWTMVSSPTTSTYRWEVDNGGTPSTATGPDVDHTLGTSTGKYVFTEASNGGNTDEAYLLSPCINLASLTSPGFEFWYHMAGPGMGTMDVQVSSNGGTTWTTLTSLTGPQQASTTAAWLKKTVSLAGYTGIVQIRWKGTKNATPPAGANTYEGDMAIDDVKFFNIPTADAELVAITAPALSGCGFTATENVTITIKNNGNAAITSIPVRYQIGTTGTPVNETASVNIAPGATGTYTFVAKANLSVAGTYVFTATTLLPGDGDPSNDSKTRTVTVVPNVSTFPYFQNFEAGNGGWTAGGTVSSWALGTPAGTVINSAASGTNAWVTNLTGDYNNNEQSFVLGPCFNFSSLTQPIVSLKIWWNMEQNYDKAALQSSIDGGVTWQHVGAFNDPDNWYNNNSTLGPGVGGGIKEGWSGRASTSNGSGGWLTAKHALTGLGGRPSVLLRVAFGSDGSGVDNGFAFDDVSIFESPSNDVGVTAITAPNSGCSLTATETVTITVKNFGSASQSNIPVRYTINGTGAINEVMPGPIAPNATANYSFNAKANLATAGTYTFVAQTNLAGDGQPGNDAFTKVVTVIPNISTLPYSQGFENGNGGWVAGGTSSSWALGTPANSVINSAASGTKAWITNLTGDYNNNEQSYVVGPCFNFASTPDPDFEMMVWWNMEQNYDKAALQSSIDGGVTWQHVGAFGNPNNWYNNNSTLGPGVGGGIKEGWSGRNSTNNGSGGWVKVKHKLTGLGGQSSVLLRIAFGSDGSGVDNGFAFDDIRIGDNTGNLSINSFVPLTKICGFTNNEKVEVVIENQGSVAAPASSFTLQYTVDGGAPITQVPTAPLAPGVPTNFVFTTGANLLASGPHTIEVKILAPTDPDLSNNTITYNVSNATVAGLPIMLDFETPATGIGAMRLVTKPKSAIVSAAGGANTGTGGMIMDGVDNAGWVTPVGVIDPWTNNLDNFSAAYICFDPSAGVPKDSLYMIFDLKQLFKVTNSSTNFRVTVNGAQVGPTYRPPFSGTPIVWERIRVDLTPYKNLNGIQIGLESSVKEAFANGAGTANLIDNLVISRRATGLKSDILAAQISVHPNPSTGIFNVSAPKGNYSIEVTDMTGRTVLKQTASGTETQLNLREAAKGIYLMKITSEGSIATKRLVIQ